MPPCSCTRPRSRRRHRRRPCPHRRPHTIALVIAPAAILLAHILAILAIFAFILAFAAITLVAVALASLPSRSHHCSHRHCRRCALPLLSETLPTPRVNDTSLLELASDLMQVPISRFSRLSRIFNLNKAKLRSLFLLPPPASRTRSTVH